ncbi:MAG: single-stranded DNA-binding protein [Actinomycetota bacterium]|nr:single-stranded DNA-binding protein [Actinomycetota bacterium]
MVSFNRVVLAGNITRDPELRFTNDGVPVCNFGLAQNDVRSRNEHVNFFDVTAWRELGETIANYKKKGDPILLEGRLQYRSWEDRESGQKRSKVDVVADQVQFLGGKGNGGGENGSGSAGGSGSRSGSGGGSRQGRGSQREEANINEEDFEDIPFRHVNHKRLNVEGIL